MAAIIEDVASYWIHRWFDVSFSTLFRDQWQRLSDDATKHLSIKKVYDINLHEKSPLLRGVQNFPLGACIALCMPIAVLPFLLLQLVLGSESVGGPCQPAVDLSRVVERLIFHPGYNPTGECLFYSA